MRTNSPLYAGVQKYNAGGERPYVATALPTPRLNLTSCTDISKMVLLAIDIIDKEYEKHDKGQKSTMA